MQQLERNYWSLDSCLSSNRHRTKTKSTNTEVVLFVLDRKKGEAGYSLNAISTISSVVKSSRSSSLHTATKSWAAPAVVRSLFNLAR